jgi:hypothetical protein
MPRGLNRQSPEVIDLLRDPGRGSKRLMPQQPPRERLEKRKEGVRGILSPAFFRFLNSALATAMRPATVRRSGKNI